MNEYASKTILVVLRFHTLKSVHDMLILVLGMLHHLILLAHGM